MIASNTIYEHFSVYCTFEDVLDPERATEVSPFCQLLGRLPEEFSSKVVGVQVTCGELLIYIGSSEWTRNMCCMHSLFVPTFDN